MISKNLYKRYNDIRIIEIQGVGKIMAFHHVELDK